MRAATLECIRTTNWGLDVLVCCQDVRWINKAVEVHTGKWMHWRVGHNYIGPLADGTMSIFVFINNSDHIWNVSNVSLVYFTSVSGWKSDNSWLFTFPPHSQHLIFYPCSPVFVPVPDMTEVMISNTPMEDMRLSPSKDRLSFQVTQTRRCFLYKCLSPCIFR